MRLAVVTLDELQPGRGPWTHVRALLEGFEAHGHRTTLFAGLAGPAAAEARACCSGGVIDLGARLSRTRPAADFIAQLRAMQRLARRARAGRRDFDLWYCRDWANVCLPPAVLQVAEYNGLPSMDRALRRGPANAAYTTLLRRREQESVRRAHALIAVSEGVADALRRRRGARDVRVIENGGADGFAPATPEARRARRAALGIPDDALVIAYVGTFAAWHDLDTPARALARLAPDGRPLHVLAVGDGPARARFLDAVGAPKGGRASRRAGSHPPLRSGRGARTHGLAASPSRLSSQRSAASPLAPSVRVHWLGTQPAAALPELLEAADAGLAPYRAGTVGSSIKLHEYMGAGLALVAARLPDTLFVEREGCGRCYLPGDDAALAAALEAWRRDPALLSAHQARARAAAPAHTWSRTVARVLAVLEDLANHARGMRPLVGSSRIARPACEGDR